MTVSLIKDSTKINDAARPRVCREVLENMGPRIELNSADYTAMYGLDPNIPLVRFPREF